MSERDRCCLSSATGRTHETDPATGVTLAASLVLTAAAAGHDFDHPAPPVKAPPAPGGTGAFDDNGNPPTTPTTSHGERRRTRASR
jgi:hypothetical protein